jgi:hypothetical protein
MTDLRAAAQQALEQPEQDSKGCDYCNHPLYAAIKCRACGRVTEPAAPESVSQQYIRELVHEKMQPFYDAFNRHPKAAPTVVEPVAWIFTPNHELLWPSEVEATNPIEVDSYRPLYAHPPRKPLTDADIEKMIATRHFDPKYVKCSSDEVCLNWYRLGLRDGEAAHGITKGKP